MLGCKVGSRSNGSDELIAHRKKIQTELRSKSHSWIRMSGCVYPQSTTNGFVLAKVNNIRIFSKILNIGYFVAQIGNFPSL